MTADGVLVALHDDTLDRIARAPEGVPKRFCSGPVIKRTLEQIKMCDLGSWFNETYPQYASDEYQRLLSKHGIDVSMSGRGDCWDNAMMESFFATLKTELVHQEGYTTHEQATQSIFEYIEVFYNRKRLHSSLGYVSPESFEAAP